MCRGRLISTMSVSENGCPTQAGHFYLNDSARTGHTVIFAGTVYEGTDSADGLNLGDTSVVAHNDKFYRAIAFKEDGGCDMYSINPEDEEGLIQRAVANAPTLKLSWARWMTLAKSGAYPTGATDLEQAVFGPHCILSASLVEKRLARKRERDTASRNKRRAEPAQPTKPRKIVKVDVDTPQAAIEADVAAGTIKLTLELPASAKAAVDLVRSALAGMADAMPL